jgi:hypothetical protein
MSIDPGIARAMQEQLAALEATITRSLTSYRDLGNALAEVKARKLYKGPYRTWWIYCHKRWGMSGRQVDRHIEGAEVANDLERAGLMVPLLCNALLLIPLSQKQRCDVWRAALAATGKDKQPASSMVEALAARALGKPLSREPTIAATMPAGRPRQLALLALTLARARELAAGLRDGRHVVDLVERAEEVVARMPQQASTAIA